MEIDANKSEILLKNLTSNVNAFKCYYKRKNKNTMMKGKFKGTVYSGHPTRTTFGNTIRLIALIKFLKHKIRLKKTDFDYLVSGDDTLFIVSKEKYRHLMDNLH